MFKYTDTTEKPDPGVGRPGRKGLKLSREAGESGGEKRYTNRNQAPVPQTDTGRWGENPKANGRRVVKELGKLTP